MAIFAPAVKSTDANSWTVYDWGSFKEYRKRVTYSQAFTSGTPTSLTLSSTNLPTGMSTLSTNYIGMSLVQNGNAWDMQVNLEMTSASASLVISVLCSSTATRTGFVDVVIMSP